MKRLVLASVLVSFGYADWSSDVLKKGTELYDSTKSRTIRLYNEKMEPETLSPEVMRVQRLNRAWDNVLDELQEGTVYIDAKKTAPESSWIGKDKEDVQKDINELFDTIIEGLVDDDLSSYKNGLEKLKAEISQNRAEILTCREKKIAAPVSSRLHTTRSEYDEKIGELQDENRILENEIRIIKSHLKKSFEQIGVMLSMEQIEVLLTRVDGDDIIKISVVMDTLQYITRQILHLMQESNEELVQAKKYYGMHQVLLELVVYIQQQYIDKTDQEYIPKITAIIDHAQEMIVQTERLKAEEEDSRRVSVYNHNIEALQWTAKVARQYRSDLIDSKQKMIEAQKVAQANLNVSRNTYETVSLSADLYDLISESQTMFVEIGKIQIPDIVPFENLQMQQKYKELTDSLK